MSFLTIILLIFIPATIVNANIGDNGHQQYIWKNYPYQPPGTNITFPDDEGSHNEEYKIEWWYANFHLTGLTTGTEYGSFVAFYLIQSNIFENLEIRLFSISDLAEEETYTNSKVGTLVASTDHLDLEFIYFNECPEYITHKVPINHEEYLMMTSIETNESLTSSQSAMGDRSESSPVQCINVENIEMPNQLIQTDSWHTKTNGDDLLPFQYNLSVGGRSHQDDHPMQLIVDMDCIKRPLIVGGDGLIELGLGDGFTYYYCLTKLLVNGTITVHEVTEEVTGYAWIDHQWGDFANPNPPPPGLVVTYEWFSIKLNDDIEIMTGDTWDRITGEKINQSYAGGLNLLNCDGVLELLEDYTITPQGFWLDDYGHLFASRWHITESTKPIDLIITPVYPDQMMYFHEDLPIIQQILAEVMPGSCFWEGVCTVSGNISGSPVEGKAYVELTHFYEG